MSRIRKLPDYIADQIAAGEVVERPACVLKEVLENSLDANARDIEIEIKSGGVELIRVTDQGCGIEEEDLPLVFEQHATSKITASADLLGVQTLGFRGEALSSISAVAKVKLISKTQDADCAFEISRAGVRKCEHPKPVAHPVGTTFEMRDLFFNLPARYKFLKTTRTEFLRTLEVFKQIALSHFGVRFSFTHNDKLLYQLPACGEPSQHQTRIQKILGAAFLKQAYYLTCEHHGLKLTGWIEKPDRAKALVRDQYCYVNHRMVKDKVIYHAIREAYTELCLPGHHPKFVLFLELDPKTLDVNVHPRKQEVRFEQPRIIHDFLTHTLEESFKQQGAQTRQSHSKPALWEQPKSILPSQENDLFFVLFDQFAFIGTDRGILFVDLLEARKIALAQRLQDRSRQGALETKPVPFSILVKNLKQIEKLESPSFKQILVDFGFDWVQFDQNTIRINRVPKAFDLKDLDGLVRRCFCATDLKADMITILLDHLTLKSPLDRQRVLEALQIIWDLESKTNKRYHLVYKPVEQAHVKAWF